MSITDLEEVVGIIKTHGIDNINVKKFYFSDYSEDPMSIFKISGGLCSSLSISLVNF